MMIITQEDSGQSSWNTKLSMCNARTQDSNILKLGGYFAKESESWALPHVASVDLSEHSNSPKEAAVWKRCANGIGINQFLVNMTSTSGIHPSAKEPLEISLFPGISLCFGHPLMGNVLTNGPLAALCQEPKFDASNEQRSSDCKNYCRPGWWGTKW